jgi:hypothetical protein
MAPDRSGDASSTTTISYSAPTELRNRTALAIMSAVVASSR